MNNHIAATPRPWSVDENILMDGETTKTVMIWGHEGPGYGRAAMAYAEHGDDSNEAVLANAELIVTAVNAHEQLVEALQKAVRELRAVDEDAQADDYADLIEEASAALELAQKGTK